MTEPRAGAWSETPGLLSEGPRWHHERGELLWVDILGRQVHRGTLAADGSLERVETTGVDRHVGAVAPAVDGGYVLAARGSCSSTRTAQSESWRSRRPAGPTCG